jgi:glycosyltransferase involved in cell wall biosynthesis
MPTPSTTRRPRILQVVSHLALGGAERVAITIAEALRDEFDFTFYAVRGIESGELGAALAAEVRALNIPLHLGARVPMRFGGVITSGIGLTRVVKRVQPDLIHLHTEIPEAAYAAMVSFSPWLRAVPLVRTIHNTVCWKFWRALGLWCDRRMPRSLVAGVSPACLTTFQRLRAESGAGAPPETPISIFNGVRFFDAPVSSRESVENRPLKLVFGGRLEEQKGTDLLPAILARVRPPSCGAQLVIHGTGSYEPLLRTLARNPPSGWSIELRVPTPDFARQLAHYDLALVPSRYEGLGLVAVEAALAQVPVIATDAEGLRDVFPVDYPWLALTGDAGDFAAKLQQALDEPKRRLAVARKALIFARAKFDIGTMACAYEALYTRALSLMTGNASAPTSHVGEYP